ncbi:hypothetical protein [Nesterenkonia alba]|uniref:hypothetical protein n=1 Tax=Nesterenkonia alba TaxID=515814 RepID=UPI0003F91153|nr:hypothetical protein [Nesterenkonia alba]
MEFLGTFLWVFVMVLVTWQGFLAMHALSQANTAARDAARAESVTPGTGPTQGAAAVSESLHSGTSVSCSPIAPDSAVSCTAEVEVPVLGMDWVAEMFPEWRVSRSATMPAEAGA